MTAASRGPMGPSATTGAFAIFPNPEVGGRAQADLLRTDRYQKLTIDGFIKTYAPPVENDSAAYQRFVRERLGVGGDTALRDLTPQQFDILLGLVRRYEGTRPGVVIDRPARGGG